MGETQYKKTNWESLDTSQMKVSLKGLPPPIPSSPTPYCSPLSALSHSALIFHGSFMLAHHSSTPEQKIMKTSLLVAHCLAHSGSGRSLGGGGGGALFPSTMGKGIKRPLEVPVDEKLALTSHEQDSRITSWKT